MPNTNAASPYSSNLPSRKNSRHTINSPPMQTVAKKSVRARPVERALTDFFATVCIGGLFIVCVEFFLDGKFELYGFVAYVLGVLPIPLITRKCTLHIRKKAENANRNAKDESTDTNEDNKSENPEDNN